MIPKKKLLGLIAFTLLFVACQQNEMFEDLGVQSELLDKNNNNSVALDEIVTRSQALEVANKCLGKSSVQNRSEQENTSVSEVKLGDETLLYVVNYQRGGFALVSAKTTYYPILAYSDNGSFSIGKEMPLEVSDWLEAHKNVLKGAYPIDEETQRAARYQWSCYLDLSDMEQAKVSRATTSEAQAYAERTHEIGIQGGYSCVPLSRAENVLQSMSLSIDFNYYKMIADQLHSPLEYTIFAFRSNNYDSAQGPLLSTSWNQGYPYNALSKEDTNNPAGCVTIAMAQTMKYYEHPQSYNWADMPNEGATQSTQELIKNISVSLGISYKSKESGTTIEETIAAFKSSKFNYNVISRSYNNSDVVNALNKSQPVFMIGFDYGRNLGHAWICDGLKYNYNGIDYFVEYRFGASGSYYYGTGGTPNLESPIKISKAYQYLHMNWGWGKKYDGWFINDNIETTNGNFNQDRVNLYVTPVK